MKLVLGVIRVFLPQIVAAASFAKLFISLSPPGAERPQWHWWVLGFYAVAILFIIWDDIGEKLKDKARRYKAADKTGINTYMHRWISKGGRTVIFTRDMSWADDKIISRLFQKKTSLRTLLKDKAKKGELIVCLQEEGAHVEDLKEAGAKILTYGSEFTPKSRFTIIDYGQNGARVAIGAKDGDHHVITEYQEGKDPLFGVANDLTKIIEERTQ